MDGMPFDGDAIEPRARDGHHRLDFGPRRKGVKPIGAQVSALAVVGRTVFCASDETGSVERLTFDSATGDFSDRVSFPLDNLLSGLGRLTEGDEVDIEGMALADGYLWVCGSQSLKRSVPDAPKSLSEFERGGWDRHRAFLGRIPLTDGDDGIPSLAAKAEASKSGGKGRGAAMLELPPDQHGGLRALFRKDTYLGPYMNLPSKENGFDVEGLAVSGSKVLLGLRGPVLGSHAFLITIMLGEADEGTLVAAGYRLQALHLGGLGVRDLLLDGKRLLILGGPTQKIESVQRVFEVNDIFAQPDVVPQNKVRALLTLPVVGWGDHAEGIALFSRKEGKAPRLLVAYDSAVQKRFDRKRDRLTIDVFDLPASSG